jgi:hypothetical protein
MSPSAIRDLNWQQLSEHVHGLRQSVYEALRQHGPCTTRQLAAKSGLDILSVRPRVTELCEMGFAVLEENPHSALCTPHSPREGIYRACSYQEAAAAHGQRQALARGEGVQDTLDFST